MILIVLCKPNIRKNDINERFLSGHVVYKQCMFGFCYDIAGVSVLTQVSAARSELCKSFGQFDSRPQKPN